MTRVLLAVLLGSALALPAAAEPAAAPTAAGRPEPKVQTTVLEDDVVRIEELRVRGQNQRLVVQTKKGLAGRYEVLPETGRDPSQPAGKGTSGQRVWNLLSF